MKPNFTCPACRTQLVRSRVPFAAGDPIRTLCPNSFCKALLPYRDDDEMFAYDLAGGWKERKAPGLKAGADNP